MKNKNKIKISILSFLSLFAAAGSIFLNSSNKIQEVTASAWSGPQTSTAGNYYNSISESATWSSLIGSLKSLISSGTQESYDWSRYEAADEAEGDSTSVLQIYARTNIKKTKHVSGSTGWNREHSYPQSKMSAPATSDNHIIFADDNKTNNTRGNKIFAELTDSATKVYDSLGNFANAYTNSSQFEPPIAAKGEVARATMYAHVRYGLSVTGNFDKIETMMVWALEQPVNNREIYRNNIIHTLQKNRNPFIDNMDYACRIWTNVSTKVTNLCNNIVDPEPEVLPNQISFTNPVYELDLNSTYTFNSEILPSNADQSVNWTSSDQSVATISSTGVVTPKKVGSTTIKVASTVRSSVATTIPLTITNDPIPATGISIDKTNQTIGVNSSIQLNANFTPSNASNKNVVWDSSNKAVATISSSGLVRGLAKGTTTISVTAEDGGHKASTTLTVAETKGYRKVTSNDDVALNGRYIIANANAEFVMSTNQANNNRIAITSTKEGLDIVPTEDTLIISLEIGSADNTFALKTNDQENGYLYAASGNSKNNYLRTKKSINDSASWSIDINQEGFASILAHGNNSRNILRYNNSSIIFSAYGSGQQDITLYVDDNSLLPVESADKIAARGLATLIMSKTGGDIITADCETNWNEAYAVYAGLSNEAKQIFKTDIEFSDALQRYTNWAIANGNDIEGVPLKTSINVNKVNAKTNVSVVVIIGLIGLTSIATYYILSRRKQA